MSKSDPKKFVIPSQPLQGIPPEQKALLQLVSDAAAARSLPVYIVGGFVRDLFLARPTSDLDLVVVGDAIPFARSLAAQFGGKVTVHARFGTAQWFLPEALLKQGPVPVSSTPVPVVLDLISARSETYPHAAVLPTVRRASLDEDLRRRDFTINTLALRLDGDHFGEVRDNLNALQDLHTGVVRVLHPASFTDDPTRIFRAVRYEQRYGFHLARETLNLIPAARPLIDNLSPKRLHHELDLILEEENAASMIKRLADLKILRVVHPALKWKPSARSRFSRGWDTAGTLASAPSRSALGWALWLMDVSKSDLAGIDKRLHFEAELRGMVQAASALLTVVKSFVGKKPGHVVALLDGYPLTAITAVFLSMPSGPQRTILHEYLETWRHIKPRTTGHTLLKLGLPAGPVYQSILWRLREAWINGDVKTDAEERELLKELTKQK